MLGELNKIIVHRKNHVEESDKNQTGCFLPDNLTDVLEKASKKGEANSFAVDDKDIVKSETSQSLEPGQSKFHTNVDQSLYRICVKMEPLKLLHIDDTITEKKSNKSNELTLDKDGEDDQLADGDTHSIIRRYTNENTDQIIKNVQDNEKEAQQAKEINKDNQL